MCYYHAKSFYSELWQSSVPFYSLNTCSYFVRTNVFQTSFQLKGSSSQFPQVVVCWGSKTAKKKEIEIPGVTPEMMSSLLNFAYTGQVSQCIHSIKIGPGHILYQRGPTSDLRAILQQRDNSRTTSIEMM